LPPLPDMARQTDIMTDSDPSLPPTRPIRHAAIEPASALQQRLRWLPSMIWVIPVVAALVGLSLLMTMLLQRGPEITVVFRSAEGLVPGKTSVRYKSVNIGQVKAVHLAPDHQHVIATLALSSDAKGLLARDTHFWIVRPRLAVSGVSGLDTLLSGAYIGVDVGKSAQRARVFTGLEQPPAITTDASGKQFQLQAADLGSLDIGSPVYYRRVQVGQVVAYRLNPDGKGISLRIFINQPYDQLVTTNSRFWQASGIDIKLDSGGIKLNTQALATVLLGGIAFQDGPDNKRLEIAAQNSQFRLAADQTEAMKPVDELQPELAVLNFDQSVRGLAPGAPLDFRGIVVGQVRSIGIEYLRDKKTFRFPVVVELYPARMGLSQAELSDRQHAHEIAESMNRRGMRAQLRTGNLLTGQLYVAFDFFPHLPPAKLSIDGPMPELATTPGTFDELQTKLVDIVNKIDKVPFDQIGQDLRTSVATLNQMLLSADGLANRFNGEVMPEVGNVLQDVRKTLQTANGALDPNAPLQQDTRRMMQEMTRAAASLRTLTDYLEHHPEALIRGRTDSKEGGQQQ
jgi:paraquat-inducible protein B